MTEILKALEECAERKAFLTLEHEEEANQVFNDWNNLVPKAEKVGITHKEMVKIWNNTEWGEKL